MMDFLNNLLLLSLEAAPWLIVGLVLGGLMKALIPQQLLEKHLSGQGLGAISKATLLGAPLPLCSCGVIPAAIGLRKAGASKPATTAFLVSTPETGVDSITVTYALLGPFMAIVRPIAALLSAMVAGILVALFDRETLAKPAPATESCCSTPETNSCCADNPATSSTCCSPQAAAASTTRCCTPAQTSDHNSCCDSAHDNSTSTSSACCSSNNTATPSNSLLHKAWSGVQYAFTNLLDDIVLWLMVGMVFAALAQTFLPPDFLAQWGHGLTAMLVILLAGIPMYICATASTPVAAGLLLAGISPGVALVLLLTGPATNISTLGVISREMGMRTMWLYLFGVASTAILSGLAVDALITLYQWDIHAQLQHQHDGLPFWLQLLSLVVLIAVVLRKPFMPKAA